MNIDITAHWNHLLEAFLPEKKDVYFTEQYVKLYESDTEKAECFVCQEGDKVLLFPFLPPTGGAAENGRHGTADLRPLP